MAGAEEGAHPKARRLRSKAQEARRREVQELTPGERMERAFQLFQLTRADA